MSKPRLNILHGIHDFLPRHQAGSELYAFDLSRELQERHHVTVLCAEFDGSRTHGQVTWRLHDGLPVVELVNNWVCRSFADTYRSSLIGERVTQILDAVQPDVVHVHNLLNLSFDLPRLAHAANAVVVATLHDYSLVCPTGGQRIHRSENHVCHEIDTERCARCFAESPFYSQMAAGQIAAAAPAPGALQSVAQAVGRRLPALAGWAVERLGRAMNSPVTASELEARLGEAQRVFGEVDLFVAPSPSLAAEFRKLGLDESRLRVSDYGFRPLGQPHGRVSTDGAPLRLGFVGSVVWHKGVHLLLDAVNRLPNDGWTLKVFGSTEVSPAYVASLEKKAAGLPVTFEGVFERGAIADVFAEVDVLVVPSIWLENSPLVIHEAFMAGVPIVGARIGGISDLVRHGENGLLYEPQSAAALADLLQGLLEDRGQVQRLSTEAPTVKTIGDDARAWESTYAELVWRRRSSVGVPAR